MQAATHAKMGKDILFTNTLVTNNCIFETKGRVVTHNPALAIMVLHEALSLLPHHDNQVWAQTQS